jgi:hypothetical protein
MQMSNETAFAFACTSRRGVMLLAQTSVSSRAAHAQCRRLVLFDQHRAHFPVLVRRQLPRQACGHGLREQRAYVLAQLRAFVPAQYVHLDHLQVRDLRCPLSCHAASFAASPGVCGSEVCRAPGSRAHVAAFSTGALERFGSRTGLESFKPCFQRWRCLA